MNRKDLVTRHDPILNEIDYKAPLTVGNGEFAFTADVTGLQTLYEDYKKHGSPLCAMSQWGWHSTPVSDMQEKYTTADLEMTEYDYAGRKVYYGVDQKPGNEQVYFWLRQNPHRMNLGRIGLIYDGREIKEQEITGIHQQLYLYEGYLQSDFYLDGERCRVRTSCHFDKAAIGIQIESELIGKGRLCLRMEFPYGSSDITGSDWNSADRHKTQVQITEDRKRIFIQRSMDRTEYQTMVRSDYDMLVSQSGRHGISIGAADGNYLSLSLTFEEGIKEKDEADRMIPGAADIFQSSKTGWEKYWNKVGLVELYRSKDSRAPELERRIVLSLYQSRIQCCGSIPPQETGLTCNSWHGKFHLEMYLWHQAYLPLWNMGELMKPSLNWYQRILPKAKANARRNSYRGAKWPKQVAYDGIDSPSPIATLLIWQQPHLIYMLELLYRCSEERAEKNGDENNENTEMLREYWELIKETADYMIDLVVYNHKTKRYDLIPPVIPAQEAHDPKITLNPIFEVEYWYFTLLLASKWAGKLGHKEQAAQWKHVAEHMAHPPVKDGLYLAHENCPETYEKFQRDHPMMTAIYGLIHSDRVDREIMKNTLHKTMECWDLHSTWGWDFAMMAMTATRLGYPELAIDLLLMDTDNNFYGASGNNTQKKREELPVYLPGNGSLLLAAAMMAAGYEGCQQECPGFPKDGNWVVSYENIHPFP